MVVTIAGILQSAARSVIHRTHAGSGASADNSHISTSEALRAALVGDEKCLEMSYLRFVARRSSVCQRVFSGPNSLNAPEPSGTRPFEAVSDQILTARLRKLSVTPVPDWIGYRWLFDRYGRAETKYPLTRSMRTRLHRQLEHRPPIPQPPSRSPTIRRPIDRPIWPLRQSREWSLAISPLETPQHCLSARGRHAVDCSQPIHTAAARNSIKISVQPQQRGIGRITSVGSITKGPQDRLDAALRNFECSASATGIPSL
jgi:hypothetical protein